MSLIVAGAPSAARSACKPAATVLKSPRAGSREVQAKALNDRGDVVGFADGNGGNGPIHAILWKGGSAEGAVDLGVPAGYVSSEAYGVNDDRVVFGLVYDRKERTFPFRWKDGRMTLLKDPTGRVQRAELAQRNAINARGEITATLWIGGAPHAVRWSNAGKATVLPMLPGHKWAWAFGINDAGIVSGWSRKLPSEDGEENPVLWTEAGEIVPLETVRGQADGIAEATNSAGLTVGYLGNLGTDSDPEHDQFAVWRTRGAKPLLMGPKTDWLIAELVDVNDRGQAAGMAGPMNSSTGFRASKPVLWQKGWTDVRPLALPAVPKSKVHVTELNDLNNRGAIVGNVFGLGAPDYGALRRIDPVLWTCAFGR